MPVFWFFRRRYSYQIGISKKLCRHSAAILLPFAVFQAQKNRLSAVRHYYILL
jgi:hypothetical protein